VQNTRAKELSLYIYIHVYIQATACRRFCRRRSLRSPLSLSMPTYTYTGYCVQNTLAKELMDSEPSTVELADGREVPLKMKVSLPPSLPHSLTHSLPLAPSRSLPLARSLSLSNSLSLSRARAPTAERWRSRSRSATSHSLVATALSY
jgi:hypothetical protein